MADYAKDGLEQALSAIANMANRTQPDKFPQSAPQHTLQKNRLDALRVAASLISGELGTPADSCTREELEKARAPIASLKSKSEKALAKLRPDTWQHTMLGENVRALEIASSLIEKRLDDINI